MPDIIIKITSRIKGSQGSVQHALGYSDEEYKFREKAFIEAGYGGWPVAANYCNPHLPMLAAARGKQFACLVYSFSSEFSEALRRRCFSPPLVMRRIVRASLGALSAHLFGSRYEIGFAMGMHHRTDHLHAHVLVCPVTSRGEHVFLVGKISPPGPCRILNHRLTPRAQILMDAANREAQSFVTAPPGTYPRFACIESIRKRLERLREERPDLREKIDEVLMFMDFCRPEHCIKSLGFVIPARGLFRFLKEHDCLIAPAPPAARRRRRSIYDLMCGDPWGQAHPVSMPEPAAAGGAGGETIKLGHGLGVVDHGRQAFMHGQATTADRASDGHGTHQAQMSARPSGTSLPASHSEPASDYGEGEGTGITP